MKHLFFFIVLCLAQMTFAHNLSDNGIPKHWTITQNNTTQTLDGYFSYCKNGNVFIEKQNHEMASFPLFAFAKSDQDFVLNKQKNIEKINQKIETANAAVQGTALNTNDLQMLFLKRLLLLFAFFGILQGVKQVFKPKSLRFAYTLFGFACVGFLYSFTTKNLATTNPLTVDAAFQPFKPNVYTRWDATYFYVESKGIPTTHTMMQGITGWQQQFPVPQCYIGANAWSIPLNPVLAATPVPVNSSHFLRGAIALAANGVAIFNPYTNTGVDAFLDGQLDTYGGHCGRADDYHYHTAPLHLYGTTSATLPIAYALDGFAVYGANEPEGGAMTTLDANHGHTGASGVYHYHGSAAAPYMIGKMVGAVTEDATLQIIPQAAAQPFRPAGAPLQGAVITSCLPNATNNGYTLVYTKAGLTYSVRYSWTAAGVYTFNFISPSGTTTSTYNGPAACNVTVGTEKDMVFDNKVVVFPNPASDIIYININDAFLEKFVRNTSIFSINGSKVAEYQGLKTSIDTKSLAKGIYFIKIETDKGIITKKIIVN
jgi:Secretion system C-terminal sorting domain/YHYH protein